MAVGSSPTQSIFYNFASKDIYYYWTCMVKSHSSKPKRVPSSLLVGDHNVIFFRFNNLFEVLSEFKKNHFIKLSTRKKFGKVNQALLKLILEAPSSNFLLAAVLEYIEEINNNQVLEEIYNFSLFEFWLNHFSGLNEEQNYEVRAKIAGKYIPRDEYQVFFPIGMGKVFSGTHFVTAHLSPDVDTTIASFWGWMDAFAARVGTGQHIWSLPGGPPNSPITTIFRDLFGPSVFLGIARTSGTLNLIAMDLVNQDNFVKENPSTSIGTLDHGANEKAIILTDKQGYYLGDWRSSDVELVRQIIILFNTCLRWLENRLQIKLISLFTKNTLHKDEISVFLDGLLNFVIVDCEPVIDFSLQQKKLLDQFLLHILGVSKGIKGTFADLNQALKNLGVFEFSQFFAEVEKLRSGLFDKKGNLVEDRPKIFRRLEKIILELNQAIFHIRNYVERLDIVMLIKKHVLNNPSQYITLYNDVEDIRLKMKNHEYLTTVIPEENDQLFPVGIVWAKDLRKQVLGTVSLRDFCNEEEIKMASYLSVISIIDHHKASLKTISTPLAILGDAQSCNVLIAEQTMLINDRYSLSGMDPKDIEKQIQRYQFDAAGSSENTRLLQKLLQRHLIANNNHYYIDPHREFVEYLCFLHAILDDTDLLTKVSYRDLICVVNLLNRLKSIQVKKDVEIVNLDNIPRDKYFTQEAARRILQNEEMYSIYKKSYGVREQEVEKILKSPEEYADLFLDTKELNGCCRIGQTKMFSSNFPTYFENRNILRKIWSKNAEEISHDKPEIDLHIHMISTIVSAEDVFHNRVGRYNHQDEMWIWVPHTQQAFNHLAIFLGAFETSSEVLKNKMKVDFLGKDTQELQQIFSRNFKTALKGKLLPEKKFSLAVLRFIAGSLNSRKSMITPYLPKLIS